MTSTAGCQQDIPKITYPPPQYIMCEHLDFGWPVRQLVQFRQDWAAGMSIEAMAKKYRRRWEECLLLAIDQLEHDWIKPRKGGIFGGAK